MKKLLCYLAVLASLLLASSDLFAQKVYQGYESRVDKAGSRELRYIRKMDVVIDDSGEDAISTPAYRTLYYLYNNRGENFMTITIVNYRKRGFVEIYMVPINIAGKRDLDNMSSYRIGLDKFGGLNFTDEGVRAALGSRMYEIDISFISSKKEHLKIKQIMDDDITDRIHYKLDS